MAVLSASLYISFPTHVARNPIDPSKETKWSLHFSERQSIPPAASKVQKEASSHCACHQGGTDAKRDKVLCALDVVGRIFQGSHEGTVCNPHINCAEHAAKEGCGPLLQAQLCRGARPVSEECLRMNIERYSALC